MRKSEDISGIYNSIHVMKVDQKMLTGNQLN